MMCHRIGRPPISTIGFGRNSVSSRKRVPAPPHSTTTFISCAPSWNYTMGRFYPPSQHHPLIPFPPRHMLPIQKLQQRNRVLPRHARPLLERRHREPFPPPPAEQRTKLLHRRPLKHQLVLDPHPPDSASTSVSDGTVNPAASNACSIFARACSSSSFSTSWCERARTTSPSPTRRSE